MTDWSWISASLSDAAGTFGSMSQCLTFEVSIASSLAKPAAWSSTRSNTRALYSERDVFGHLENVRGTDPAVCILAFTNPSVESNGKLPLPLSKALFKRIIQGFDISETFLTVLNTGLAFYTSTMRRRSTTGHENFQVAHVTVQQNRSYSGFAMAITYDLETDRTRALIFGAKPSTVVELYGYLDSVRQYIRVPMVLPVIAMELQAHELSAVIKSCQSQVRSIETSTGMRHFSHSNDRVSPDQQGWKTMDLLSVTRDLSSLLSRFAFIKTQAETSTYLIEQMTQDTKSILSEAFQPGSAQVNDLIYKLGHVSSWYHGLTARCQYLSERTNAQTQTVYCLIASQDNTTSIEIARTSQSIAEASQKENEAMRAMAELSRRDNEVMIQISKDSRVMAIATARDSAAMQVIAAITILFLPATFTATFFSMTFFEFQGHDTPRVSPWTWIYVVVTVVLTLIIQLAWWVISRRRTDQIAAIKTASSS